MSRSEREGVRVNQEAQRKYESKISEIVARQTERLEMRKLSEARMLHRKYYYIPFTPSDARPGAFVVNKAVYKAAGPESCVIGEVKSISKPDMSALVQFNDGAYFYPYGDLLLLVPKGGDTKFKEDNPNLSFRREKSYE